MSFELTELQDSARKVVADAGVAGNESELWTQITELGWLMVTVPESLSGLEAGTQGACAIHSELGRGLSTAPYLPAMLAVEAICQSSLVDRESWLERIFGGELITASLSECCVDLEDGKLDGTVIGVQSASDAGHVLLWSCDQDVVALVDLQKNGVTVTSKPTWDQTRRLFDVDLEDVALGDHVVLAEGTVAKHLIRQLMSLRDFYLAADAIGGAQAMLDMTVEHLQTRIQFKRPLALFQALKHRCADMKASIVAAEAMLYDALRKIDGHLETGDCTAKAMGAKMFCTSMFAQVAEDCLQLHGGIGMADEHPCHLFLKRALLSEQLCGSATKNAIHLAQDLIEKSRKTLVEKSP
ncbi:MAG: acyl-CoA dehydrogenase [Ketobacter sp.]|nr:MAG: acyl-CoA dehydrogenase [Ketobacter sp.]